MKENIMNWIKIEKDPLKEMPDSGIALAIIRSHLGYEIDIIAPFTQIDVKNNKRTILEFLYQNGEKLRGPIYFWCAIPSFTTRDPYISLEKSQIESAT